MKKNPLVPESEEKQAQHFHGGNDKKYVGGQASLSADET